MPLYDHHCNDCGCEFERETKVDFKFQKCPSCGGVAHRIVSIPNMITRNDGKRSWGTSFWRESPKKIKKGGGEKI
jgi:putative FmdB family regulatory protein